MRFALLCYEPPLLIDTIMNTTCLASTKRTRPASFETANSESSRDRHRPAVAFRNAFNCIRSKHVWYSDGNALIRCSPPAGVTVFRVHLTLLSRYALVFAGDLLASPLFDKVELSHSYGEASPSLVLDLSVRRTCEFEHFLRSIYEHRYAPLQCAPGPAARVDIYH